ncbi:MAG: winged helix-turn-helix transcriptional regulator [Acidimicrobiales bacterium]
MTRQPETTGDPGQGEPGGEALAAAVEQVGERWTLLVVWSLLSGPRRFGDLLGAMPGVAPNILSQRLKRLVRDGLVVVEPYSRRPPRHLYRLSAGGEELSGALRLLAHWGAQRPGTDQAVRHGACGTAMEARWYCPTCDLVLDEAALAQESPEGVIEL